MRNHHYTRFTVVAVGCLVAAVLSSDVQAQSPYAYGFQAYGFYQPYGIQYRSSTPTPPYFALNPPVYYGTRYTRPYGISPFATPPQASAPCGYQGQAAPSSQRALNYPVGNPFICHSCSVDKKPANSVATNTAKKQESPFKLGQIQTNPFAQSESYFASR